MADPYATVADYQVRTGQTLTGPAADQVTALLADASAIVRSILPAGYEPDADAARAVVVAMVRRGMTNPGGRRSITMGGYSATLDQDGGLYLTDAERDLLLAGYEGDGASGAYTVGLRDEAFLPRAHDFTRCW